MTPTEEMLRKQARQRVNTRVYRGLMPHAKELPCAGCDRRWEEGDVLFHYHHKSGYDHEHALDVEPLCRACHTKKHPGKQRDTVCELHSVRLDSDVWAAIKKLPVSLNQYLRSNLLGEMRVAGAQGTVAVEKRDGRVSATVNVRSPLLKPSQRKP